MNICLIVCHPGLSSLNAALADAYQRGAEASGHTVRRLNLYEMEFDLSVHLGDDQHQQTLEPVLQEAQNAIIWAQHLVLVFPMWWYGLPARLKGFLDRVLTSKWAYRYESPHSLRWRKLLKGRSARVIYTMDTPPFVVRWLAGDPVWHALKWGTLGFVGFGPLYRTALGSVKLSTPAQRQRWLDRVEEYGKRAR